MYDHAPQLTATGDKMQPTDSPTDETYRAQVLAQLAQQTKSLETIKTIAALFTVLFFLGMLCWAVVYIRGA